MRKVGLLCVLLHRFLRVRIAQIASRAQSIAQLAACFTYMISDGTGGTATAMVTITISASGQPGGALYLPLIRR